MSATPHDHLDDASRVLDRMAARLETLARAFRGEADAITRAVQAEIPPA